MQTVRVDLGERSYDIVIAPGLLGRIGEEFLARKVAGELFLVSNPTVFDLYGANVMSALTSRFELTPILIPDGESAKSLETVEKVYTYLIARKAQRDTTLVALGGGVTGDIVGFVAATFLRGVSYIQLPTTLLAQVDSSVGGKTGVNHQLGKNLIGAFYQPHLVCIDTDSLSTLPEREYCSGIYEVLKYGLIYDRGFFEFVEHHREELRKRENGCLERVIRRCCEIKASVTSADERERGLRQILNYGHTVGHALEASLGFKGITHGEAVAYGMLTAARISEQLKLLKSDEVDVIRQSLLAVGTLPDVESVEFETLAEAMTLDKKRKDERIRFVLLEGIGQTTIRDDLSLELIERCWASTLGDVGRSRSADIVE